MIDERLQELAALHALDLLEGAEKSAFTAELATNAELQKLVRELREAASGIALAARQRSPSAELKSNVLQRIDESRKAASSGGARSQLTFRPSLIVPWLIAAGLAVGCFWLSKRYVSTRADYAVLQEQHTLAELETASVQNQLEAERIIANRQIADATEQLASLNAQMVQSTKKIGEATGIIGDLYQQVDTGRADLLNQQRQLSQLGENLATATAQVSELRQRLQDEGNLAQFKIATLASMAGNSSQALAVAVWNPKTQQGVLRVEKLPALASDKDYQLWLIDPAYPAPVDGGVFTVDPATGHAQISFRPNQRVNNAAKFAVSLERKGGVPKAEGPILLLGD